MNTFVKNNSLLITSKCIIYPAGNNSASWRATNNWNGSTIGNVTTVGTNGGPSAYGTYDQSGLLEEFLENYYNTVGGIINMYRHAASFDDGANYLGYSLSGALNSINIDARGVQRGFRVASLDNSNGYNNFVTVCDPNNSASDINGYGAVSYSFKISKYLITNNEYKDFLIAIASIDNAPSTSSNVYTSDMGTNVSGGIFRTLVGGSGSNSQYTYSIKANMGNKPVNYISWRNAARYANWLHNGKPNGSQNAGTTEDGAYDVSLSIPVRKAGAKYFLPNIDEWVKAGFYKGGSTNAGYWTYATQSNTPPIPVIATTIGDGIIPTIVFGNLYNDYSKPMVSMFGFGGRAIGFNTNSDTKLKLLSIVLGNGASNTANIYSDTGGLPGTLLYSSGLGPTYLSNFKYRYYFNNVTLSPNTNYWITLNSDWKITNNDPLGNLSLQPVDAPIAMNGSSYSFVNVAINSGGVWSIYNPPAGSTYQRNLGLSLECYT